MYTFPTLSDLIKKIDDVVIRQVAKQIQQERLRLKKEQQTKKAIAEATKAVENLRNYLKK